MTKLASALLAATLLAAEPAIVDVQKIWDAAPHNAFTDLVHYKGSFFCVFREGSGHVSPDGKLRVLVSKDGKKWESAALISSSTGDLRDAKITITPDNRLMLSGAAALRQPAAALHQSYVWFSKDGRSWSDPNPVADPNYWLWRINWFKGRAYGFAYGTAGDRADRALRLYASPDGIKYEAVVPDAGIKNFPNEHAMDFRKDGTAIVLLRRDPLGSGAQSQLPTALAGTAWFDPDAGTLKEFLTLPSGGDTSYAGLVWHDNILWVSYYSSHEGKTSIYLARVTL